MPTFNTLFYGIPPKESAPVETTKDYSTWASGLSYAGVTTSNNAISVGAGGTAFSGVPAITNVEGISSSEYTTMPNTTVYPTTPVYTIPSSFTVTGNPILNSGTYVLPANVFPNSGNISATPYVWPNGQNAYGNGYPEMVPAEEGVYEVKGGKVIVKKVKVTDQAIEEVMKKFDPPSDVNVGELMDLLAAEDREV